MDRQQLLNRIKNYLASGGFFNPEAMEHEKVRDLVIACRTYLEGGEAKIDPDALYQEAQVLSSAEHLAAVFGCAVEALAPYKDVIERARLVSEHEFMKRLKALMEGEDKEAIRLWAQVTKLLEIDKTIPETGESMTSARVKEILNRK
jgi:hypothetical protein